MIKAKFITDDGKKVIPVHFNPSEYRIASGTNDADADDSRLASEKNETLSVQLVFDTYTISAALWDLPSIPVEREDVRVYTEPIAELAARRGNKPLVTFSWGSVNFKGIITSVAQKFTMFLDDGKPVRVVMDVVMRGVGQESFAASGKGKDWSGGDWKNGLQIPNPRALLEP